MHCAKDGRSQKAKRKLELIDRQADVLLRERFGRYPPGNRVSEYVEGLATRLSDSPNVTVTHRWESENACALPSGAVFLSDRLVQMCDSEEELIFVLGHELRHISSGHAEKSLGGITDTSSLFRMLGLRRLQEYESDVRSMIDSGEKGQNPFGGIVFLNRLHEMEQEAHSNGGIVHGSSLVRLLSLHYTSRLVDLPAISRNLTPIPQAVKDEISGSEDPWRVIAKNPTHHNEPQPVQDERLATARTCGPITSLHMLKKISERHGRNSGTRTLSGRVQNDYDGEILRILEDRLDRFIGNEFESLEKPDVEVMRSLLLTLAAGMKGDSLLSAVHRLLSPSYKDESGASGRFKLLQILEALKEVPPGFVLECDPSDFVMGLISHIKSIKPFEVEDCSFMVYTVVRLLREAYEAKSTMDVDWRALSKQAVLAAIEGQEEDVRLFLALLDISDSVFSQGDRLEILSAMQKRYSLSDERMSELEPKLWGKGHFGKDELAKKLIKGDYKGALEALKALESLSVAEKLERLSSQFSNPTLFLVEKEAIANCYLEIFEDMSFLNHPLLPSTYEDFIALVRLICQFPHEVQRDEAFKTLHDCTVRPERISYGELKEVYAAVRGSVPNQGKGSRIFFHQLFSIWALDAMEDLPRQEFFALLKSAYEDFDVRYLKENIEVHRFYNDYRVYLISRMIEEFDFDLEDVRQADQFLSLCSYCDDADLKSQAMRKAIRKIIPQLPARELRRLLFEDRRLDGTTLADLREHVIEEHIVSPLELEDLTKEAIKKLTDDTRIHEKAGKLILADAVIGSLFRDKLSALKTLLMTGQSDKALKRQLYSEWAFAYEEYLQDKKSMAGVPPLQTYYERLFKADPATRYAIVQALLIGERGILLGTKKMQLVGWYFDTFVEKPSDESGRRLMGFLRDSFFEVARKADIPTMYFLVAPLVLERMLQRPEEPTPWKDIIPEHPDANASSAMVLDAISGKTFSIRDYGNYDSSDKETRARQSLISSYLTFHAEEQGVPEKRKLSPVEFVRNIAGRIGSPGVRFLQVLGLYADIPDEYRAEFDKVYDAMRGQPKLSAFHTLSREWSGGELTQMKASVGGGSLLTVYELDVSGRREAAKVLNPNALFHTEAMCALLEDVFSATEHSDIAIPILKDIGEWIEKDVNFQGALELDERFRSLNDGWRAAGSAYKIRVPRSFGGENKFLKREEFVEGKNLTAWDALIEDGHDMKDIISTIVKNAAFQVASGQIHADIHPGNIRVTPENGISYLDRNLLIELDGHDRNLLLAIQACGADASCLADAVSAYLSPEDDGWLTETIRNRVSDGGDPASVISRIAVDVRKEGYDIPLRLTLILKNMLSLDNMCKRAGFSGIADAFSYQAK